MKSTNLSLQKQRAERINGLFYRKSYECVYVDEINSLSKNSQMHRKFIKISPLISLALTVFILISRSSFHFYDSAKIYALSLIIYLAIANTCGNSIYL
jgi:hypothetical protein